MQLTFFEVGCSWLHPGPERLVPTNSGLGRVWRGCAKLRDRTQGENLRVSGCPCAASSCGFRSARAPTPPAPLASFCARFCAVSVRVYASAPVHIHKALIFRRFAVRLLSQKRTNGPLTATHPGGHRARPRVGFLSPLRCRPTKTGLTKTTQSVIMESIKERT